MPWTRQQTVAALDRLAAMVDQMREDYPDAGDFCIAFAGEADVIADSAAREDCAMVNERITAMLERCGMWSGDDAT